MPAKVCTGLEAHVFVLHVVCFTSAIDYIRNDYSGSVSPPVGNFEYKDLCQHQHVQFVLRLLAVTVLADSILLIVQVVP